MFAIQKLAYYLSLFDFVPLCIVQKHAHFFCFGLSTPYSTIPIALPYFLVAVCLLAFRITMLYSMWILTDDIFSQKILCTIRKYLCLLIILFHYQRDDITPSLLQLPWLPVKYRMQYKMCTLNYWLYVSPTCLSDVTSCRSDQCTPVYSHLHRLIMQ